MHLSRFSPCNLALTARATLSVALIGCVMQASAQNFPVKPVKVVAPFPPGSGPDAIVRLLSARMGESMGQPLVIDSRPGASGIIGAQNVAKSPPDGYSLLFCTSAQIVTNPFLIRDLPYDPVRDFTPVSLLVEPADTTFSVQASLPVSNVRELIDLARKQPGRLSYGSSGIGSIPFFTGELFKLATGVDLLHVPYKEIGRAHV